MERYQEEILADDRANLRIRIRVAKGYLLENNEAVVVETGTITHLGYRYHLQNERNELVFRAFFLQSWIENPSSPWF